MGAKQRETEQGGPSRGPDQRSTEYQSARAPELQSTRASELQSAKTPEHQSDQKSVQVIAQAPPHWMRVEIADDQLK